jgi:hypothetical protein
MYGDALEWSAHVRRVHTGEEWKPAVTILATWTELIVADVAAFGERILRAVETHLAIPQADRPSENVTLTMRLPDSAAYLAAVREAMRKLGVG